MNKKIWEAWRKFWFETDSVAQMRVFRLGLGILLFFFYLIRSLDLDLFYSDLGIAPLADLPDLMPMEFRYSLFHLFPGHTALWVGNVLFLVSLLGIAFHVLPRGSAIFAWVLHLSFVHRNIAVSYGVDMICNFYLFYLTFAEVRDRLPKKPDLRSSLGSMAYRLCQIQLCIIYAYSGLHKLRGVTWWNGDALWLSLANSQMARWDFSWLAHFPLLLAGVGWITVAWEVYFPALVWIPRVRKPLLICGIVLHLGIALAINIPFFGALMVFSYSLFLEKPSAYRVLGWVWGRVHKFAPIIKVKTPHAEEFSV